MHGQDEMSNGHARRCIVSAYDLNKCDRVGSDFILMSPCGLSQGPTCNYYY